MQPSSASYFDINQPAFNLGTVVLKMDILVVDDNLINRRLAKLMLDCLGHSIDVVNNGREAIDAVKARDYNIIFMNMHMPVMDGMDATRAIRSMDFPKNFTKIIGFTGDESLANRKAYMSCGIDDIIFAPIDLNKLSETILKCFL